MADARDIGRVEAVFRYPVKSMAGEALSSADVGWHGVDGDRRWAVRRIGIESGMPWLTASRLPELLRFVPMLPTHVRAPDGRELTLDDLDQEIARLHGAPVELMRLDRGIFDEGTVSVISEATIAGIGEACGRGLEVRRFRPNILIRTDAPCVFEEDAWVGGALSFGEDGGDGPALHVTLRDERCAMLNLDPDTAASDPRVMKAVVEMNGNHAGVYATVIRRGRVAVGQRVTLTTS